MFFFDSVYLQGTYQPLAGQTSCTTCPTDTTTLGEGATQAGQCLAKCPPGTQVGSFSK